MAKIIYNSKDHPYDELTLQMTFSGTDEEYRERAKYVTADEAANATLVCEQLNEAPAVWELFFCMGLTGDDTECFPYNRVLLLLNCNFTPQHDGELRTNQLPVWHAAVICLQDDVPQRVLFVKDTPTLAKVYAKFPPQCLKTLSGFDMDAFFHNITVETYDIGEQPIPHSERLNSLLVTPSLGWPSTKARESAITMLQKAGLHFKEGADAQSTVEYVLDTPVIKLRLHYIMTVYYTDGLTYLVQSDAIFGDPSTFDISLDEEDDTEEF